jgi:hypothetical protein
MTALSLFLKNEPVYAISLIVCLALACCFLAGIAFLYYRMYMRQK